MDIVIKIPDNLSKDQELVLINKHLSKSLIANSQKLLSDGKNDFTIIDPQDTIKIIRYTKERKFKTVECSVCNCLYQKSKGTALFNNYGGIARRSTVCSLNCANVFIELVGTDRVSLVRKEIKIKFLIK